jgi:hypothetical protein
MKISLAGPSYTAASVVAAAQQTMNLIPEPIEVPNEPTRITLYGRPGIKLFASHSALLRAMWAGGGRLFVVYADQLWEVHSDGTMAARTGTLALGSGTLDPAQIFSNGHQLLVVLGGRAYCDNGGAGAGPIPLFFSQSGIGDTHVSGSQLVRTSGPPFAASWAGQNIIVDDLIYTVLTVSVPDMLVLNPPTVNATGVTWVMPNPPNGDPVTAVTGGILDSYFIVNRVPTPGVANDPGRNFNISGLNDGTMWDPLDFGVKEGHSDYIRSILCDHEELWLFGTETTEIWANAGDPNFPFQRIPGAYIHQGSVATFAPDSVGLTVCWLAGGPNGQTVAWQAQGLQPKRISTYAQESAWNSPGFTVADATSYGYSDGGHTFWQVDFWAMNRTFVFDLTTGLWHERAAWSGTAFTRYQPWYHAFVPEWGTGGKHIVGDPATGTLYEMASTYYSDNNLPIAYQRAFPHLLNEDQWGFHHRFELYAETGTYSGTGPVPTGQLDWSDDRGHTFGTPRVFNGGLGIGADYKRRLVARRLGKARDRVYRIHIEAVDKIALVDTFLEMTQGFA